MFGSFVFTHLDLWGIQQLLPFRHSQICLLKCTVPNDVPQWRPRIVQCNPVRFALIFHAQTQSCKRCRPKGTGLGFRVMKTCSVTFIVSNSVIPIFRIVRERLLQRRKEQWSKLNWQLTNVALVCLFVCFFVCLFLCLFACLFVLITFQLVYRLAQVYELGRRGGLQSPSYGHHVIFWAKR